MKKTGLIVFILCITVITGALDACGNRGIDQETEQQADIAVEENCVYQTLADLTHNGVNETVAVMVYPKSKEYPGGLYQINVYNALGELLWNEERMQTAVETGGYYLVYQEEEYYLLYYRPDIVSCMGDYAYRLFFLGEDGSETECDADEILFTATNEEGVTVSFSSEELIAFAEKANSYLADAYLLLDTTTFPVHYSTQENLVTYEEKYDLLMNCAGIRDTGDMVQNVEAYYNWLHSEKDKK